MFWLIFECIYIKSFFIVFFVDFPELSPNLRFLTYWLLMTYGFYILFETTAAIL